MNLTSELLALLGEPPHGRWLDLGCGDGKTVEILSFLGCDAFGIDTNCADNGRLLRCDMLALPFSAGELNGAIAECSLSVCGDTRAALRECAKALKIGGTLLLSDVFFPEREASVCPTLSLGAGATFSEWRRTLVECGFDVELAEDRSDAWHDYVLQQLWKGVSLKEQWDCKGSCENSGYFIALARRM